MQIHEGHLSAAAKKVGIVVSRFNDMITGQLLAGAVDSLRRHGVTEADIHVFKVPGAFEIPSAAKKITDKGGFDGVVCLGAVVRGDTPHFDYVAAEVSKGTAQLAMTASIPIAFGVLTTDTIDQALVRAGTKGGNKGFEAATSLVEMMSLFDTVEKA